MRPLINLRQFLALLLLLIVPAVLLTAYFRNSGADSGAASGHHGPATQPATGDHHGPAAANPTQQPSANPMDHSQMSGMQQSPAPEADPVEAARAQLEASRAQLEASRKILEAAQNKPQKPAAAPPASGENPPAPSPSPEASKHPH